MCLSGAHRLGAENGRFGGQGPPGGDEEDLGPQAPEAENGRF